MAEHLTFTTYSGGSINVSAASTIYFHPSVYGTDTIWYTTSGHSLDAPFEEAPQKSFDLDLRKNAKDPRSEELKDCQEDIATILKKRIDKHYYLGEYAQAEMLQGLALELKEYFSKKEGKQE